MRACRTSSSRWPPTLDNRVPNPSEQNLLHVLPPWSATAGPSPEDAPLADSDLLRLLPAADSEAPEVYKGAVATLFGLTNPAYTHLNGTIVVAKKQRADGRWEVELPDGDRVSAPAHKIHTHSLPEADILLDVTV